MRAGDDEVTSRFDQIIQIIAQGDDRFFFPLRTVTYIIQAMGETKHQAPESAFQDSPSISASESALWGRLLDPVSAELSPEAARYILGLQFPQSDIDRMQELAEKARAGALTLEEHIEMDNYERVGHVLSLMKSKARKSLKKARAAH